MWCSRSARNIWRSHVSGKRTVAEMYAALVAKGALRDDPQQRVMAAACTPLLQYMETLQHGSGEVCHTSLPQGSSRPSWTFLSRLRDGVRRRVRPNRTTRDVAMHFPENVGVARKTGLYLWGPVGIGKTVVMDLFELCDTPGVGKRRAHLHSFMSDIVLRLHRANGTPDAAPVDTVVGDVLRESPVLCLDEFQTFDVAHAALLAGFFARALPRGLILVTTSNRPPQELTRVSTAFEQFVPLLYRHCEVVQCAASRDFRENASNSHHHDIFLYPNTKENARRLVRRVERGFKGKGCTWIKDELLWLYGRQLRVPYSCDGVALFDFADMCHQLGPPDFQCIAKTFHTVIITNVPQIGVVSKNAAQQFIILVDEFYQYNVKLLLTSVVPWEQLLDATPMDTCSSNSTNTSSGDARSNITGDYHSDSYYTEGEDERSGYNTYYDFRNEEELLSFDRVASRLKEMGCVHYLLRDHAHFLISDYNLSALLE